jgi:hypothetical protein
MIHKRTPAPASGPADASATVPSQTSQMGCPQTFHTTRGYTNTSPQTRANTCAGLGSDLWGPLVLAQKREPHAADSLTRRDGRAPPGIRHALCNSGQEVIAAPGIRGNPAADGNPVAPFIK